jgi:hypothetical protein
MSNPFGKKNPFLSMWLSGAHSVAARMRGHATAQVKRQAATAAKKATKDATDLWVDAWLPKAAKRTRKRR